MAPKQKTVEQQTSEIIRHLVEDDFPVFQCSEVETDGPTGEGSFFSRYLQAAPAAVFPSRNRPNPSPLNNSCMFLYVSDEFDAGLIAGKMISIADSLHDSVVFRQALNDFKKEVAKEVSGPSGALLF